MNISQLIGTAMRGAITALTQEDEEPDTQEEAMNEEAVTKHAEEIAKLHQSIEELQRQNDSLHKAIEELQEQDVLPDGWKDTVREHATECVESAADDFDYGEAANNTVHWGDIIEESGCVENAFANLDVGDHIDVSDLVGDAITEAVDEYDFDDAVTSTVERMVSDKLARVILSIASQERARAEKRAAEIEAEEAAVDDSIHSIESEAQEEIEEQARAAAAEANA